jgi:hypothetical protein
VCAAGVQIERVIARRQLFFDVTVNTLVQARAVLLVRHFGQVADWGAFEIGRRTSNVLRHFLQENS